MKNSIFKIFTLFSLFALHATCNGDISNQIGDIKNKIIALLLRRSDYKGSIDDQIRIFSNRYDCPRDIQQQVDAEMTESKRQELSKNGYAVLSSYIVKDGNFFFPDTKYVAFYRLINAIRMQRAIEHHGLQDNWTIPKKYWDFKNNVVIAEKVNNTPYDSIPHDLYVEEKLIANRTDYADFHDGNIFWDSEKEKLTLIDTGCESFAPFLHIITQYINRSDKSPSYFFRSNNGNLYLRGEQLLKQAGITNLFDITEKLEKYDDRDLDFCALKKHLDQNGCLESNYDSFKQFFQNFDCN